ncbi:extracellular solute-binding protein [Bacillus shivajii]|uniref:ABC transporter substrate-binding protein n=1 Tax=Bacillus shivajii TaxID=1983719 RepID=UPI001CF9329A|nr:extracellular solute-binding protein [Bacillus shivajii]UCZ52882.1 extracellular solute-binding protein [Bacillus shivajii]
MIRTFVRASLLCMFLLMLVVFVACQSPSGSSSVEGESEEQATGGQSDGEQESSVDEENTLQLLIPNYYNDVEREQWGQVVDRFKELNPDIDVVLETGDVRVESGSLTALLQSEVNTPDVILMNAGPSRISVLSQGELIKPLDDTYEANQWENAVRPFAYDLIAGGDHIYEVPHMVDAIAHFYNIDVFDEYGLDVPETADEYIDLLETLAEESGIDPITVGARNGYAIGWLFGVMLEAMAGTEKLEEIFFEDGKWNDPEVVEVATAMTEWLDKGYISQDAVTLQETDSKFKFLNKQAAIYTGGTYLITDLAEEGLHDSVGFFMAPSFIDGEEAKPTGGIGQSWVVPTGANNEDAAELWLDYILSSDYAEIVYSFPDYNFILASTASMDVEPVGDVLRDAAIDVADGSGYNPSVFIGVETGEAYFQNLQGLVGDLTTPEEAMNAIEEAAQADKANGFQLKR